MKIHEKIRILRKEKNWTQEEMAEKLGMSILGYAKVERGETDYQFGLENYLAKIMKIATVLNVDLEKLLEDMEKTVYLVGLIGGDNHGFNNPIVGSPTELTFETQKLQLIIKNKDSEIEHKNETIALKNTEIENLKTQITQLQKINTLLEEKTTKS
jgi:transcriptional regulator with XRE-family HTH domain